MELNNEFVGISLGISNLGDLGLFYGDVSFYEQLAVLVEVYTHAHIVSLVIACTPPVTAMSLNRAKCRRIANVRRPSAFETRVLARVEDHRYSVCDANSS